MSHIPVLQREALESLQVASTDTIVDCTLGSGGHARAILGSLNGGTYIGFDIDPEAHQDNQDLRTDTINTVHLVQDNFRNITAALADLGITEVDGILADFGWRIEQFTDGKRGFSFSSEDPLLMTYGNPDEYAFTARDIVNDWSAESIANVLYGYGQERFSRRIAKVIVETRTATPIETAKQLAELIVSCYPKHLRFGKTHPATKSFQALRIAVNEEWAVIEELLRDGVALLKPGGRMALITFHSLEDKLVKETFRTFARDQRATIITKRPIVASEEELQSNPRARSAKLRVIERI